MNNDDYTDLYNLLLKGINEYDPYDNQQLVKQIDGHQGFAPFLNKYDDIRLSKEINRALLNMREDKLIRASVTPVKMGYYIFIFNGLTSEGHKYLSVISEPKAWIKVKQALHDEGIPLTPQSASKFIGKVFF